MQTGRRSPALLESDQAPEGKRELSKRLREVLKTLRNPSEPLTTKFFSKWEEVVRDFLVSDDLKGELVQQLDIAGGYKQLFELGLLTEDDRLEMKEIAGWVETTLNRCHLLAKLSMSEESQIVMMK